MAATNFTPIILYHTTTASAAPTAGNLNNGELAINITDGKLFYKDNGGTVKVIAGTGGTGVVAGSNTQIQFNNNGVFGASSSLTWNGTTLTTQNLSLTGNVTSNLIFTDNTYDIGASGATRPRNLFLAGNATIGGNQTLTGSLTVDSTTDSSSTTTGSIQTDGGLGVAKAAYIGTTLNIGGLTSGRVAYVTTSGRITDSANLTFDGTTLTAANFADSSLTAGRVTYAGASGNLTDSGNLIFSGNQLSVQNSAAATGPTNSSYAISAVGGNNLILNLSANGEAYTLNTASAKYQYYQAGTVISIGTNYVSGSGTAALIDFNAYNSGGSATDLYLGAVSGPNANGAAIFVLGRRTGATSWAESLRIDENGGFSTTPAANGNTVFNENGVDSDFRVESDTNTHALFVDAGNSSVSIGTSTPGPASSLTVTGIIRPNLGIVSGNQIMGFVASNYSGTRYWLLHDMTGNPQTAFNCMGDVHAASYTTWNLSNLWIRREYNTYNVYGGITGVTNNATTVSIVDITYNSSRYVAIKFAGGDPGIEANLVGYLMNQQYNGNDPTFINGTAGVTENAVIATY